jgi:hypothetical protein
MAKQPMDYLRSRKQKVSRDVWVPYDSNDADEIQRLEGELADAQERTRDNPRDTDAQDKVAALKAELEDLREELKPNCAHFVVRSLGRKEYDDLQDAYPPVRSRSRSPRSRRSSSGTPRSGTRPRSWVSSPSASR